MNKKYKKLIVYTKLKLEYWSLIIQESQYIFMCLNTNQHISASYMW